MHFVLYSWSELVEIDKHCQHLEDALECIDNLVIHLKKTDNEKLYQSNLIIIQNELQTQLQSILKQFQE
jgi:hypothetical protein|tara:strand:- start:973 stop:1179 length:207 start_codon:yes stop_codon:yes gene_type:complete